MTDESERRHIPAWVDRARLMKETCLSDRCVDNWVRDGLLPAARHRGGKLMWEWAEVHSYLRDGGPSAQSLEDGIKQRARALRKHA